MNLNDNQLTKLRHIMSEAKPGEHIAEPIFVFCAPDDFGEMLEFARRWSEHPDYPT